jgi:hypothetical protein
MVDMTNNSAADQVNVSHPPTTAPANIPRVQIDLVGE